MAENFEKFFLSFLTFLVVFLALTSATKVKQRFDYELATSKAVKSILPGIKEMQLDEESFRKNEARWFDGFNHYLKKMNSTYDFLSDLKSGSANATGHYDGMIGLVQRGEADIAFQTLRPESLVHIPGLDEPVRVGPPVAPADVLIMSAKAKTRKTGIEVTDVSEKFNEQIYAFFAAMVIVSAVILGASLVLDQNSSKHERTIVEQFTRRMVHSLWSMFETIVDQENFQPKCWSNRILWFHVCLAIFITVFGIFLNLMSCDQIAEQPSKEIDSIEDALDDPDFSWETPVIVTQFWLEGLLKTSAPDTKLGRMYKKILQDTKRSIFNEKLSSESFGPVMARMDKVLANRTDYLLVAEVMHRRMIRPAGCVFEAYSRPGFMSKWHASRELFAAGTINYFYSKKLLHAQRTLIDYCLKNSFEFALTRPGTAELLEIVVGKFSAILPNGLTLPMRQCMWNLKDKPENLVLPIERKQLVTTFFLVGYGFVAAIVLSAMELVTFALTQKLQLRRRRLERRMSKVLWKSIKRRDSYPPNVHPPKVSP